MDVWIQPQRLFDGQEFLSEALLRVQDGKVAEVLCQGTKPEVQPVKVAGIVTPGFVDLQVNGGGDVMLNTAPTREGMRIIAEAHRGLGTTAVMPTIITDNPNILDQAADAAIQARNDDGIVGLHIEGPHIALNRRGTHAGEFVRTMDDRTLDVAAKLVSQNVSVMITLAPEAVTPEQIGHLTKLGVVVSLGHTDATSDQMRVAIKAGARCATHLFNAMSPMTGREAGAVGSVINSELYSGIICDGVHVADEMIGLALRARPVANRMFLVSDAMATVGGSGKFELYGDKIALKEGRLINSEGSLAGAHITQAQGVKRLVEHVGISLPDALKMATSIPSACINRPEFGTLLGRKLSEIIALSDTLEYQSDLAGLVN